MRNFLPGEADIPSDSMGWQRAVRNESNNIVLSANTLEAFVRSAGAAMNVSAANGLWAKDAVSIKIDLTLRKDGPLPSQERRRGVTGHPLGRVSIRKKATVPNSFFWAVFAARKFV